jgi:hypothetical protein
MATVKKISSGNYTITANSVIHNTLANVVTGINNINLDLNASLHTFIPSPISTAGSAILANGTAGQTLTLTSYASANWTVKINSAAWQSYSGTSTSGNIIFSNQNTSVTLRWTPELYGWAVLSSLGSVTVTT